MRIENWKEFERDCDLLGYDVCAAETEAQLHYSEDAWSDTIDYTDAEGVRVYMEQVKPAYYNIMRDGEIVHDVPEDEMTAADWDNEEFYPEETAEAVFHYDNIISRLESAIYDAWDGLTDDEKKAAFERFAEINNPEYYESPKYTRWAVDTDEDDADDYTEEIATAIIRERDGLGVDVFDNLIKLYFNKYM